VGVVTEFRVIQKTHASSQCLCPRRQSTHPALTRLCRSTGSPHPLVHRARWLIGQWVFLSRPVASLTHSGSNARKASVSLRAAPSGQTCCDTALAQLSTDCAPAHSTELAVFPISCSHDTPHCRQKSQCVYASEVPATVLSFTNGAPHSDTGDCTHCWLY
jgi:hypothetical protein